MPSRVEDYEVLFTIGSGSYGKCQKIRRKSDGKILVWKELDYGTMTESEKQMLVSEVNLLRELRHPNIVRYYDRIIDRTNTTLYIVMEHCEGGDLASLITRCIKESYSPPNLFLVASSGKATVVDVLKQNWKYLDEEFIIKVLAQLSLALKECHRRSDGGHVVLHRDLKPANIFLDYKQNVKLGDFGLARILNHDTSFAKTFVGTPYYMSPEQINRMSYNEKSDIWSLGCLLYELCALSPPFTAYNQKDLAEKIREGKFRRIPYRYSEGLNTLITRMLNLKDYLRPSVEAIIQNSLIAGIVADEQKNYEKTRRKSSDYEKPLPSESSASELKLKEQQLQEREQALKEREERLEQREHELCLRERLCEDKLERAENLMKNYTLLKQRPFLTPAFSNVIDEYVTNSIGKKKVHFAADRKENQMLEGARDNVTHSKDKCEELKKRLQAANLQARVLDEMEKNYNTKSKLILGMR